LTCDFWAEFEENKCKGKKQQQIHGMKTKNSTAIATAGGYRSKGSSGGGECNPLGSFTAALRMTVETGDDTEVWT
jgi:hypothetical protein